MLSLLIALACQIAGENFKEDQAVRAELFKLKSLGRRGEADRIAKESRDPVALGIHALSICRDDTDLRLRGITEFDKKEAERIAEAVLPYFKQQAGRDPKCGHLLANYYIEGLGVKRSEPLAIKWWTSAAIQGEPSSMNCLGLCYRDGEGVPKDFKQAFAWFKKSASTGNPFGMVLLGEAYEHGEGVKQDPGAASRWYEKSADMGSVDAMSICASIAFKRAMDSIAKKDVAGSNSYLRSYEKWIRKAATLGDANSQFKLAGLLRVGSKRDPSESFSWYKKGAESGVSLQTAQLACCYATGWGCTENWNRAEQLFRLASDAASREDNDEIKDKITRILSNKEAPERLESLRVSFGWQPLLEPFALDAPLPLHDEAATATGSKLVLTDLVLSPIGIGFTVEGRFKNVSDEPLKNLRIEVSLEDSVGRFLGTITGYATPDTISPGKLGTFKALDLNHQNVDHAKLEFTTSGESIPWADKSGKDAHQ